MSTSRAPLLPRLLVLAALVAGCGGGAAPSQHAAEAAAWTAQGDAAYAQGALPQAEQSYARALELDPESAAAAFGLGRALFQRSVVYVGAPSVDREVLRAARAQLERAVELDPRDPEHHFWLGLAQERDTEFEAACASFEEALRLEPTHPRAAVRLGTTLLRAGEPEAARAALERALRDHPDDPEAHYQRGLVEQELGAWAEGGRYLARAVELRPGHAATYYALANSLNRMGHPEEAAEALRRYEALKERQL